MTAPAQFEILREQVITSTPRPGQSRRIVAVTYSLAARPPQVVFIPAGEVPDIVFLETHPQETEAPANLVEEGRIVRFRRIQAQINRTGPPERAS